MSFKLKLVNASNIIAVFDPCKNEFGQQQKKKGAETVLYLFAGLTDVKATFEIAT